MFFDQVVREDGTWCIKAISIGSASALYHKMEYDLKEYPFLAWRWKVNRVIAKGDELLKEVFAPYYQVYPNATSTEFMYSSGQF